MKDNTLDYKHNVAPAYDEWGAPFTFADGKFYGFGYPSWMDEKTRKEIIGFLKLAVKSALHELNAGWIEKYRIPAGQVELKKDTYFRGISFPGILKTGCAPAYVDEYNIVANASYCQHLDHSPEIEVRTRYHYRGIECETKISYHPKKDSEVSLRIHELLSA